MWIAFIKSPQGRIWTSTASMAEGTEAEFKARRWAEEKFCAELVGSLIKEPPVHSLWQAASRSGFECVCMEISD